MTQISHDFVGRYAARQQIERAFEYAKETFDLPAAGVTVTHDSVYVSLATADDLLPWLHELGGLITTTATDAGVELWTLATIIMRGDGAAIPVRVSVPVCSQAVHDIAAEVQIATSKSPAARVDALLRGAWQARGLVSTEVVSPTELAVVAHPLSDEAWDWWYRVLSLSEDAEDGPLLTASGRVGPVTVRFTGQSNDLRRAA
ncbi:hypothetical protein ACIP5N_34140 [Streptomyces sp. NPDC088768]|uniref:hypothetical protein n=1 Tax=Streptomyces sp. NPDC088768 TaxID=3365894 RepID=UPI00381D23F6